MTSHHKTTTKNLSLLKVVLLVGGAAAFVSSAVFLFNAAAALALVAAFGVALLGYLCQRPSAAVFYTLLSIPFGGLEVPLFGKTPKVFYPTVLSIVLVLAALFRFFDQGGDSSSGEAPL